MLGARLGSSRRASATSIRSAVMPARAQASTQRGSKAGSSSLVRTKKPSVSSTPCLPMRRRIMFSSMHSRADSLSLTAYRAPLCSRPWKRELVPWASPPCSSSRAGTPRMLRSRRMPIPVAPPPMMITVVSFTLSSALRSDNYSFGIFVCEIIRRSRPFPLLTGHCCVKMAAGGGKGRLQQGIRLCRIPAMGAGAGWDLAVLLPFFFIFETWETRHAAS